MTATADRFGPGRSREELRLVEIASGLLMLLDAHRLTGRLPLDVQVQASRLRHAVKQAVQAEAARTTALPPAPPAASRDQAAALQAWIATQPWTQPGPVGWVYLLCFRDPATGQHRPLQGNGVRGQYAGHYWGWTDDLIRRITREHRNPRWRGAGRLVQVALAAGLSFELAWLEYPATRGRERRLKNQGSAYRRCPLCRGTGGPLDPAAAVAAIQPSPLPHPWAPVRRRDPGPLLDGRAAHRQPTNPREGVAREPSQPLGPAGRQLGHPRMGSPGRPRPPPPPDRPIGRTLALAHPGRHRLPGRDRLRPSPRRPHPRPVAARPVHHRPGRRRGHPAHYPPHRRPGTLGSGPVRVCGRVPAGRADRHHRHRHRPRFHRRQGGQQPPRSAAGAGQDHRRVPRLAQPVAGVGRTERRPQSSSATVPDPTGQAMARSPTAPTSTRRPL